MIQAWQALLLFAALVVAVSAVAVATLAAFYAALKLFQMHVCRGHAGACGRPLAPPFGAVGSVPGSSAREIIRGHGGSA